VCQDFGDAAKPWGGRLGRVTFRATLSVPSAGAPRPHSGQVCVRVEAQPLGCLDDDANEDRSIAPEQLLDQLV
jgi:hypothetical protein